MSTTYKRGAALLAKEIGQLYLDTTFSDVTIVIDGVEIPVHRMILSQRCPYFKTMFASAMIESTSNRIELRETPINGLKAILKWIYTGEIELSQVDTAVEVARLSDMFLLTELEKLATNYVEEFQLKSHGTSFEKSISEQSGVAQLAEEIGLLYLNEAFSDVTIVVDGTELPAHRMILSQRCTYLKTLLEATPKRIEIRETTINGFKSVLKWIYTGNVEFSSMDTALEVLRLSNMYELVDLEDETTYYIWNNSNIDNFCSILNSVTSWSPRRSLVYDCLEESGSAVLVHETFLDLSKDSMKVMLKDLPDDLTNVEILQAFARWMKANPDKSEHFPDLLKLISLNSISLGELASIVPSELMSANVLMKVAREQQFLNENGKKDTNFATAKYGAKITIDNMHVFMSKRFLYELVVDTNEVVIDLGQRVKLNTFTAFRPKRYSVISPIDISVSPDEANWTCVVDQGSLLDDTFKAFNFDERVVRFIRIRGDAPLNEVLELDAFEAYYE